MAPVKNGRVLFNDIPTGYPEPGKTTVHDTTQTIDPDTVALNGGFLLKTLVISIDPYQRGKMRDPSVPSYSPAYTIGKPISNDGVSVVVRSENPALKAGDVVHGYIEYVEYSIHSDATRFRVLENKEKLPLSLYLGVLGMAGKTAHHAWNEYASVKEGDVVFVSGGAGPVGSFVIQLAKMAGLKVIASAGTEGKVQFLKDIGTDVAFNYKTTPTKDVLDQHGPINIYWDNVGGETLDAALVSAAPGARFIECGMITGYNNDGAPIKNLFQVVARRIHMFGFLVATLQEKYRKEFNEVVPGLIASGKLKYTETRYQGLENAGQALLDIQTGKNEGKAVVIVSEL